MVLARPTRSRSLYAQMVGRGLRLFPGKNLLLIIDFEWLTKKHQLLMDPTALLLADELPEVQAAAREPSDDPVGDVRRGAGDLPALPGGLSLLPGRSMAPGTAGRRAQPSGRAAGVATAVTEADSGPIVIPYRRLGADDSR